MKIRSVDIALKKPGSDSQQMGRVGAGGKHRFVKVFVSPPHPHDGEASVCLNVDDRRKARQERLGTQREGS